jgi:hypothetical protein
MSTDRYTKIILTVIACGLLALVVQNATGPSDAPIAQSEAAPPNTAPSNTAPSHREARVFEKIHLCNSQGCIEIATCDARLQHFSGVCADSTGDRLTTTPP